MTNDPDDPRRLLGPLDVPPPPADFVPRVLRAAAPLLAARARRGALVRPLLVALLPLPLIVVANLAAAGLLHAVLSLVLPAPLTTYLVAQYGLFVLLALTLAYGAVPLLADRQARATLEESHV
jgi:hypothetical protein